MNALKKGSKNTGNIVCNWKLCRPFPPTMGAKQEENLENANLDKAERQEGHVVSTEQGVEQHFLDSPIEVALQLLHF